MSWHVTALTLFPEMFPGFLGYSLAGKGLEQGLWSLDVVNIRDYAIDKFNTVDDKPFGGGSGMVLRPDVLSAALEPVISADDRRPLIYLSPRGKLWDQEQAIELSKEKGAIFVCGRFEGVDQRVIDEYSMREISVGDFILSGGEVAALTVCDSCIRLLPGVLKNQETLSEESFSGNDDFTGLLEYPHYTRPSTWRSFTVPDVLLSGNHANIRYWRKAQAEEITRIRRPDLWERYIHNRDKNV